MRKPFPDILFFVSVAFFFGNCAQQIGPSGGPKDVEPPRIVESIPENFSTRFDGQKIKIRFDEFVQLKDLQTKMIISPPLKEIPEFRIRGKTLEFSFKDTLRPNTTYNFQFGDAIVDNNEGNPLDSNLFVFSTGEEIDSLWISGKIKKAFDLSPEKKVLVMAYNEFSDSLPYRSRPVYFSKTNDEGYFKIRFMKEGKYKVFALKDGNGDFLFDNPDEMVGFPDSLVNAGDSSEIGIFLFKEDAVRQFLKRGFSEYYGKLIFVFTRPSEGAKAHPLNRSLKNDWFVEELSEKGDSLIYWLTDPEGIDTLQLEVSDNSGILDTVEIILPRKDEKPLKRMKGKPEGFPSKLEINVNAGSSLPFDFFSKLILEAVHPVKILDTTGVFLIEGTDTLKMQFAPAGKAKRKFEVLHSWKEAAEYKLFIPPGAMVDIFGLKNDSLLVGFKTRKKEEYGVINVKLETDSGSRRVPQYIYQLMDEKDNVLKEQYGDGGQVKFENIVASKYKLKLIFDENRNSVWDAGNYLKKIQPEKVLFYPSSLELRPKFDLDVNWKINVR